MLPMCVHFKSYRFSVCGRQREMFIMLMCLMTLLFVTLLIINFRSRGYIVPPQADSTAQPTLDVLTRSEALRHHVKNACKALDFKESKMQSVTLPYLLYDDTHKVIYCYIPKVSCTSWKTVFLKMTGKVPLEQNITSNRVHTMPLPLLAFSKNPEEKLQTYRKFLFVRHPFERAVSAFRNKLEEKNGVVEFSSTGMIIEKKYRGTTKTKGHNVTFSEFIRYISELGPNTPYQQNDHWLPMHELCAPCSVEYDFIGRMENLEEDADYVLKWLEVRELVGGFPGAINAVNAKQHVTKYLEQLTRAERLAFYAKFLPDYLLFDYRFL